MVELPVSVVTLDAVFDLPSRNDPPVAADAVPPTATTNAMVATTPEYDGFIALDLRLNLRDTDKALRSIRSVCRCVVRIR